MTRTCAGISRCTGPARATSGCWPGSTGRTPTGTTTADRPARSRWPTAACWSSTGCRAAGGSRGGGRARGVPGGRRLGRRRLAVGEAVAFGPGHVHDVAHGGEGSAISIHAYSPPLSAMTYYTATDYGLIRRGT